MTLDVVACPESRGELRGHESGNYFVVGGGGGGDDDNDSDDDHDDDKDDKMTIIIITMTTEWCSSLFCSRFFALCTLTNTYTHGRTE